MYVLKIITKYRVLIVILFKFVLESHVVSRVLNGEFYERRFQKLIHLHLFTDCFMKMSPHSSEHIQFYWYKTHLNCTILHIYIHKMSTKNKMSYHVALSFRLFQVSSQKFILQICSSISSIRQQQWELVMKIWMWWCRSSINVSSNMMTKLQRLEHKVTLKYNIINLYQNLTYQN